jgi:hypothetical protein
MCSLPLLEAAAAARLQLADGDARERRWRTAPSRLPAVAAMADGGSGGADARGGGGGGGDSLRRRARHTGPSFEGFDAAPPSNDDRDALVIEAARARRRAAGSMRRSMG